MPDKKLKSGAVLTINKACWEDASDLHDALLAEIKGVQLSRAEFDVDFDPMQPLTLLKSPAIVGIAIDKLISVAASKPVRTVLFRCFERCLYDGQKVDVDLFNDPKVGTQARKDYYEIAVSVAKENVADFFVNAFSVLTEMLPTMLNIPGPESGQPTK